MGGSNPNMATPQQAAQPSVALDATGGSNSPLGFYEAKPWKVPDFTPKESKEEKKGGSDAGQMAGQLLKMYLANNGKGGFNSMTQAKLAAPNAAGYSNVEGIGIVPQAKGVNYEPDQMERLYGYGYGKQ
jgi:hypothetical protein